MSSPPPDRPIILGCQRPATSSHPQRLTQHLGGRHLTPTIYVTDWRPQPELKTLLTAMPRGVLRLHNYHLCDTQNAAENAENANSEMT